MLPPCLPLADWPAQERRDLVGVFTDIDDTLTTHGAITTDALQALANLKAAGLTVIAITGRPIGWCAPFMTGTDAPAWPVDAMVAENGAVAFSYQDGQRPTPNGHRVLSKQYQQDAVTRAANQRRIQDIAARVLREVPDARLTRDSAGRETDLAFDYNEFEQLTPAQVQQVLAILQAAGMHTTVSSIHIHGCFGDFNKWQGACWIVRERFGRDLALELDRWAFVGDSGNDQAMFQHFKHSLGVANIARFEEQLTYLPQYITPSERGAGFAEVTRAILQARRMTTPSSATPVPGASLGLTAILVSTFFELVSHFMLMPLLLLRMKGAEVSTTVAGLFAATGWLGIFVMTPFASTIANRMGRRPAMWAAGLVLTVSALLFTLTDKLWLWFALNLASGIAMALRWVLAEALIAEFCPPEQRGRYVGFFQTLVSTTFITGPAALVWMGANNPHTLWVVVGFSALGLAWTALIPKVPHAQDADTAHVGLHGLWQALRAHPIIMLAGFVGGFFETGVTSILPLYGLALGLGAGAAALLVSASGLGGVIIMLPAGMVADRFSDQAKGRRTLMVFFASVMLAATCVLPFVATIDWLAWPIVFLWGGAGGTLYTMAMTDIGTREKGITLVNSTAVLVLTYTLGGLTASGMSGALIDWSPTVGFPLVLIAVAAMGLIALVRSRRTADL